MDISRFIKPIILTGAGFTKNFGGLVVSGMANSIFSSDYLTPFPELKKILQTIRNYEEFYQEILTGGYSDEEKTAVQNAISEAYDKIDKKVREWDWLNDNDVHIHGLINLLRLFAGGANQCGAFFTLNQDPFVERDRLGDVHIELPCVSRTPRHRRPLNPSDIVTLPTSEKFAEMLNGAIHPLNTASRTLYYFKLHGSYNWLSSDGSKRMVIGPDKEGQINREPLLKWYKGDIFTKLLNRDGVKLLVIGYSFGDSHINLIIAQAINDKGLKFCVVCPKDRVTFTEENLLSIDCGEILAGGMAKYWECDLGSIFPGDQSNTTESSEIKRWLFG